MEWISKLDPNIIAPVVIGIGTWLWRKLRSEKKSDDRSVIDSVMETFAAELLDSYHVNDSRSVTEYLKQARAYIDARIWIVLAKRGIKKSRLSRMLVDQSIEQWSAWVGRQLIAAKTQRK